MCGLSSSGLLLIKIELLNFFNEKMRLAKLLEDEELYWKKWAKAFWLENSDLNTNFFTHKLRVVRLPIRLVLLLMIMV